MQASQIEETIARRFRLQSAPSLVSRQDSGAPIALTRLRAEEAYSGWTAVMAPESAFSFHVALAPVVSAEVRSGGKGFRLAALSPGSVLLYDLAESPVARLPANYDFFRFYLTVQSMDQINFDLDLPRVEGLRTGLQGSVDAVLHGLALAALPALDRPGEANALFVDSIALAFHSHAMRCYADTVQGETRNLGGLLPWQLRRVRDFIEAHLDGDPSIKDLARECNLSGSHFARAFRRAVGTPPHRWLMQRRIERAKELLLDRSVELAEIAVACGFVDQSHLTRAFTKSEGYSPGKWRRLRAARPSPPQAEARYLRAEPPARSAAGPVL